MNKYPITTGIIGHRDAQITEDHKALVKNIFKELHRRYPHSPVVLFSQLAIGADSFVADWFLEVKQKLEADFRLISVLPYDRTYYERSQFSTDAERQHFSKLINQSERLIVLEQLPEDLKKQWDMQPDTHPQELNPYYRRGGEFVADGSMIFFALWDEKDNNLEGGTANTVRYKKTGSYKSFITDHIFDNDGDLINIPCNRKGANEKKRLPKKPLEKLLKNNKAIRRALEQTETLNKSLTKVDKTAIQTSASYLFPVDIPINDEDSRLRHFYALSDTLALKYQKRYLLVLNLLFFLGFLIFLSFDIYKHFGLNKYAFFSTITLLAVAYVLYKFFLRFDYHNKYIDYRILAEALRVQFFWNLSGIRKQVESYILRLHEKEYRWLHHVLNGIFSFTYTGQPFPSPHINMVEKHWVENQKQYFNKKIKDHKKSKKRFDYISYIVLGIGLLLLFGIYLLNIIEGHSHLIHWLIVADTLLFGSFAIMKAYYEKRGYKDTLAQYELMKDIYTASDSKLDVIQKQLYNLPKEKEKAMKKILELTGKEALIENGSWYLIYKEKEPEVKGFG